uniref:diacylglycerol O-acyltransferase n=1 Tax=Lygus hesperus TaxID=30085 RepID=A0A0A9Y2P7_LYGHE
MFPLWRWFFSHFPCSVQFEVPLSHSRQYILSSHPHGVLSLHHAFYMTSREFHAQLPGKWKRHVGATIVFKTPLYRELMLWCGVIDADRRVVDDVLSKGYS